VRSVEIVQVLYSWKCTFTFEFKSSVSWILIVRIQKVGPTLHICCWFERMWKGLEPWDMPATEILRENQLWIFFSFVERHWEEIQEKIKTLSIVILLACLISTHFMKDFKVSSMRFTCSLIYRFTLSITERGFRLSLEVRALKHIESISFIIRNEALSVSWRRIQHSMRRLECPRHLSKSWSFSVHKNLFRVCLCVCVCVCVCT